MATLTEILVYIFWVFGNTGIAYPNYMDVIPLYIEEHSESAEN